MLQVNSLKIPANPPAGLFWSITGYNEKTHSFATNTEYVAIGPQNPGYKVNDDCTVDVYFRPTPPKSGNSEDSIQHNF